MTETNQAQMAEVAASGVKRLSFWQRLVNIVFGYDYFISYRWSDGKVYAGALEKQLTLDGFECFLDSSDYRIGDNWKRAGYWILRKTTALIVVGSPGTLDSGPVLREVKIFSKLKRRIVPIDFDGTLDPTANHSELLVLLPTEIIRLEEKRERLKIGPSQEVIQRLSQDFIGIRQNRRRIGVFSGAAVVFALLAVVATGFAVVADQARQRAESRRQLAVSQSVAARVIRQVEASEEVESAALMARAAYQMHLANGGQASDPLIDEAVRSVIDFSTFNNVLHNADDQVRMVAINSDESLLAFVVEDGTVFVQDLTGRVVEPRSLGRHKLRVNDLQFHINGSLLASVSQSGLKLWNVDPAVGVPLQPPFANSIRAFQFSADGRFLFTGGADNWIRAWDLETNQIDAFMTELPDTESKGGISALALGPGNDSIAVLQKRRAQSSSVLLVSRDKSIRKLVESTHSKELAFTPTGDAVLTISQKAVKLHLTKADSMVRGYKIDPPSIIQSTNLLTMALSKDGQKIAAGGLDGKIRIWNLEKPGEPTRLLVGHRRTIRSLAFSPDGNRLYSASGDRTVRSWHLQPEFKEPRRRSSHESEITGLSFSSDGSWLAVAGSQDGVRVLDFRRNFVELRSLPAVGPWTLFVSVGGIDGIAWGSTSRLAWRSGDSELVLSEVQTVSNLHGITLLPSEHKLIAASSFGLLIWDLDKGTKGYRRLASGYFGAVATSIKQGAVAAVGNKGLYYWADINSNEHKFITVAVPEVGNWYSVALSRDAERIAAGGKIGTLLLWQTSDLAQSPQEFEGHTANVRAVAFDPAGNLLASGGEDGSVRLWNIQDPGLPPRILTTGESQVRAVAFSPDGKYLIAGNDDGEIIAWTVSTEALADRICELVKRELSTNEFNALVDSDQEQSSIWTHRFRRLLGSPQRSVDVVKPCAPARVNLPE